MNESPDYFNSLETTTSKVDAADGGTTMKERCNSNIYEEMILDLKFIFIAKKIHY